MHETGRKGDIGVAAVTADLLEQNYEILIPISSCSPFDLAVCNGTSLIRVQVKYATKKAGCVVAKLGRKVIYSNVVKRRRFEPGEVDVVAVYCPDTRQCYYIKTSQIGEYARFRLDASKNEHAVGVRLAEEYRKFPLSETA